MTNLRQLHDRYGQSSWLTTAPAVTSPVTIRCGTSPTPMCCPDGTTDGRSQT
jgi:hypothetical protein